MSFKKYRFIDLLVFLLLFLLFEFLIGKASTKWFVGEPFVVSLTIPFLLLIGMRWDKFSLIHCVLFGLYYVVIYSSSYTLAQFLIYIIGNLGFVLAILFLKLVGKEKVRTNIYLTIIYVVIGFLSIELFRGLSAIIFAKQSIAIIPQYLFTDLLNLVFALVIVLIARTRDGLFMDQKTYLFKLDKERKQAQNEFFVEDK